MEQHIIFPKVRVEVKSGNEKDEDGRCGGGGGEEEEEVKRETLEFLKEENSAPHLRWIGYRKVKMELFLNENMREKNIKRGIYYD